MFIQVQPDTMPAQPGARARLRRIQAHLLAIYRTHQERQELRGLDDRALRDFGANPLDARTEARRRFWDLPPMA